MSIERQNILDLIGANKNKYSSCIITCYSFDFAFFEERIMSILRTANIKNVNVFLDGKHLEQSLENTTGHEFKTHKTYSLNPIYHPGVFHPKIMLLTGPKHGLLVIGSGNLTASGLSTNDEIWGAFHMNGLDSPNVPVFAAAWNYLLPYFGMAKGFNQQKIDWIYQHSKWVEDLPGLVPQDFISVKYGVGLKLISNNTQSSIYKEMLESLPESPIETLTVISPYFDKNGQLLEQLNTDLDINEFICIMDKDFGLLPYDLGPTVLEKSKFFDWKDCLKNFDVRFNRLHAKIFHFKYADGLEYLLFGSANATISAFGSKESIAKNGESSLLLRRQKSVNYITELGINLENIIPFRIDEIERKEALVLGSIETVSFQNRILYCELNGAMFRAYFSKSIDANTYVKIVNSNNDAIGVYDIETSIMDVKIEIEQPNNAFKVCLIHDDNRVSNFQIIHNIANQAKCNPDPYQAELNQIIESLSDNPENDAYIELLRHADYNWVDEETNTTSLAQSSLPSIRPLIKENKEYEKISQESFYKLQSVQSRHTDLLNNSSTKIADILSLISKGLVSQIQTYQDDEEQMLASVNLEKQTGEGVALPQAKISRKRGKYEQTAIINHLKKVYKFYFEQSKSLREKGNFQDVPKRPLTIKDLSNISIALNLLYIFFGKKYVITKTQFKLTFSKIHEQTIIEIEKKYALTRLEKTDPDTLSTVFYEVDSEDFLALKNQLLENDQNLLLEQDEYIISEYSIDYLKQGKFEGPWKSDVKSILINLIGNLLINSNSNAGFSNYEYDLLNEKVLALQSDIFVMATFLMSNMDWNYYEQVYLDLILLDLLFFYSEDSVHDNLEKELRSIFDKANHKAKEFNDNVRHYDELILRYMKWKRHYDKDKFKVVSIVREGAIVFNRNIGFAKVKRKGVDYIQLIKPGLEWDDMYGFQMIKVQYQQEKIVTF